MELEDENAKYAFLLGSTLRNEDADRFINIYDAIVPKDIPPYQVVDLFLASLKLFSSEDGPIPMNVKSCWSCFSCALCVSIKLVH